LVIRPSLSWREWRTKSSQPSEAVKGLSLDGELRLLFSSKKENGRCEYRSYRLRLLRHQRAIDHINTRKRMIAIVNFNQIDTSTVWKHPGGVLHESKHCSVPPRQQFGRVHEGQRKKDYHCSCGPKPKKVNPNPV